VQTPVAAGLAWYIAHTLLGHHQPFFAPTAAVVSLSKVRVLRGQRALQLIVGVVLGIGIGTAVRAVAGSSQGGWSAVAIGVAVLITLVAALALGGGFFEQGVLFVNQSATSAVLMIAVVGTATASERLSDALIGGGVTLVITVVLLPAAPLRLIKEAAQQVFAALRDTVAHLAALPAPVDPAWALTAGQLIHRRLADLEQARSTAVQVASIAPRRWPDRSRVRQAGERTEPVHLLAATVLSLVHARMTAPALPARADPPADPPADPAAPGSGALALPEHPAVREALRELVSAFAALAEDIDDNATQATAHADRARTLVASLPADLTSTLIETCAADTVRLTEPPPSRLFTRTGQ
jgi:uncharacterized membrane protein YgaE (UPF0421/DUF939 family)